MTHHTGSDEGLSEAEREALDIALDPIGDPRGEFLAVRVHEAVEDILAARAAAPDALMAEAITAAVGEHAEHMETYTLPALQAGFMDGWSHALRLLRRDAGFVADRAQRKFRAALADPTDGATT